MTEWQLALTFLGLITLSLAVITTIITLIRAAKYLISVMRRKYIYKHRFNKPPTAKCYCKDCIYWTESDQFCTYFGGWYTDEAWFCWNARPKD